MIDQIVDDERRKQTQNVSEEQKALTLTKSRKHDRKAGANVTTLS